MYIFFYFYFYLTFKSTLIHCNAFHLVICFIELLPTLLAHNSVADWTAHSCTGSFLYGLLCFSLSHRSQFPVADGAGLRVCLECLLLVNALLLFWANCFLSMINACCVLMLAEEANTTIARQEAFLSTPLRPSVVIL